MASPFFAKSKILLEFGAGPWLGGRMNTIMKTKRVVYYVDLLPHWMDADYLPYFMTPESAGEKSDLARRVKVSVELPEVVHEFETAINGEIISDSGS